ncbi:MAG TPA: sugar phosphate isomerase/epimerase [Verrucomicrobia bacterium]|nr:sugar phosphate isomerase/epimerase [Verrucomicrobiota bacterium]HPU56639.1 sugar phosphate isomerase/epimerase family protein [Verrucomicrobiota bacterium]
MLIGTMNHPGRDLLGEIRWIADMGFDFVDLTLEPPMALASRVNLPALQKLLQDTKLKVVGHTAYYLPLCSPFESIRRAAVEELKNCLAVFAQLGARWMNVHPDRQAPMHERSFIIDRNVQSLKELFEAAAGTGVGLMIENLPGSFNTVRQLGQLLEPLPQLGLHLDVGHANLLTEQNTTDDILRAYGARLKHVHLHDNKGGSADLHLPLGAGTMDIRYYVQVLKNFGYDGTITLEVFTPDRHHLAYSRDVLRRMWDEPLTAAFAPRNAVG